MVSKYPVRPRFEHSKVLTTNFIILDGERFQTVKRKRKALGSLTESAVNTTANQTRLEKPGPGRPSTAVKLASKETGQQTIQFLSSRNFSETFGSSKQRMKTVEKLTPELVAETFTLSPYLW